MLLTLDHLIIRSATPEETLLQLAERTGAPVLAEVEDVRGMASGIVRAGTVDIEVLRLGDEPPERPHGYGVGFVADRPLDEAIAELRSLGFPTSVAPRVTAGSGSERRSWRATQVHGLLPDPFPAPVSMRRPGLADRLDGGPQVHLDDAGPAGIRRIVLSGAAGASFALGDVEFELA